MIADASSAPTRADDAETSLADPARDALPPSRHGGKSETRERTLPSRVAQALAVLVPPRIVGNKNAAQVHCDRHASLVKAQINVTIVVVFYVFFLGLEPTGSAPVNYASHCRQ